MKTTPLTVLLGVALMLGATACGSSSAQSAAPARQAGPRLVNDAGIPDHMHAALGVNICETWQAGPVWKGSAAQTVGRAKDPMTYAGLHTHELVDGTSDGLIHMEPSTADEAGDNATLGKYMEFGGWTVTTTALKLWDVDGKAIVADSKDGCNGKPATIRWTVADTGDKASKPTEQTSDPNEYQLHDLDAIAIYLVAPDADLSSYGPVPSVKNLPTAHERG